jgi:aspartate aminotransferase
MPEPTTSGRYPEPIMSMPRSGIRVVMDLAWEVGDVLHLEVGEPDFPTPDPVVEAAVTAARAGFTKYVPNTGIAPLREALVDKLARLNGITTTPEQVIVTVGAVAALACTLLATAPAGCDVLLPDPGWPNYAMQLHLMGARPIYYPLRPELGFEPDIDQLESLLTSRTRVILINSPSNPVGSVWRAETMRAIVEFALRHDLILISDEVYERIVFEGEHISPAVFAPPEAPIVSIYSFSKTYAMTGWRVGYAVAPPPINGMIARLQEPTVSCGSSISQKAALAALALDPGVVETMVAAYRERRDLAYNLLSERGVGVFRPEGAFYMWIDIAESGRGSDDFARSLIAEARVAVAPGATFGPGSDRWIRISLANSLEVIEAGCRRIADFLGR